MASLKVLYTMDFEMHVGGKAVNPHELSCTK